MTSIIEILSNAVQSREVLTVGYSGGSRPGRARGLVVTEVFSHRFHAVEPGIGIQKTFMVDRVLWVETASGVRAESAAAVKEFEDSYVTFGSLAECGEFLRHEYEPKGWVVTVSEEQLAVGTRFKNGNPRKTPSITLRYLDRSYREYFDVDKGEVVREERELTGRERPWRVDSHRFGEGRSFGSVEQGIRVFLEEVAASNPDTARCLG